MTFELSENQKKLEKDCAEYLERNHYDNYILQYVLKRNNLKGEDNPYRYSAVAGNGEYVLFFDVYAAEGKSDIYWVTVCGIDDDLFFELEQNHCSIEVMTMEGHFDAWEELGNIPWDEITYRDGLQRYLNYCQEHNITKDTIINAIGLYVTDIMQNLDKAAVKELPDDLKKCQQSHSRL